MRVQKTVVAVRRVESLLGDRSEFRRSRTIITTSLSDKMKAKNSNLEQKGSVIRKNLDKKRIQTHKVSVAKGRFSKFRNEAVYVDRRVSLLDIKVLQSNPQFMW